MTDEASQAQAVAQLTVRLPGEPHQVSFPVALDETIMEVSDSLTSLPVTKQYTSFNLKRGGSILPVGTRVDSTMSEAEKRDSSAGKAVELTFTLVPAAYTERSAREHVVKVREMAALEKPGFAGSMGDLSGEAEGSTSWASLGLDPVRENAGEENSGEGKNSGENEKSSGEADKSDKPGKPDKGGKPDKAEEPDEAAKLDDTTVSTVLPAILSTQPHVAAFAGVASATHPALRSLQVSDWAAAGQQRRLRGDLFYLRCQTLEGETFHVTASVGGFFVNNSSGAHFDGAPRLLAGRVQRSHSLVTLLQGLSPKFTAQMAANAEAVTARPAATVMQPSNCFLASPWLVKRAAQPVPDGARVQREYLRAGEAERLWNAEFQELRGLPKTDVQQAVNREAVLNRLTFDFTAAAVQGAAAVVGGSVTPMNPDDDPAQYVYLRAGIFYSLAVDSTGEFADEGGDEAARAAVARDLAGVRLMNRLDLTGVSHLLSTVVDYYGHRVVCQAPVPGIFERPATEAASENASADKSDKAETPAETASITSYGLSYPEKSVVAAPRMVKKLADVGTAMHMKKHTVWDEAGHVVSVPTSVRTKGLRGTDGRDYVIDLYRTTPVDIEFRDSHPAYPHREVVLRHEAVEEWWRRKAAEVMKAADKGKKGTAGEESAGEESAGEKSAEKDSADKEASAASAALTEQVFSIGLNPDAFSLPPAPTPELATQLKADEEEVREASKFVAHTLIPELVSTIESGDSYTPLDGDHLTSLMHRAGINMRYLGDVVREVERHIDAVNKERSALRAQVAKENVVTEAAQKKEQERALKIAQDRAQKIKDAQKAGKKIPSFDEEDKEEQKHQRQLREKQTNRASQNDALAALRALRSIAQTEMVVRGVKHLLRAQLAHTALPVVALVVAHVHNCLLTPVGAPSVEKPEIDAQLAELYDLPASAPVLSMDTAQVLSAVAEIVHARFSYELTGDWAHQLHPWAVMKGVATKFGLQWRSRDYAFTAESLATQIDAQKASAAERRSQRESKKLHERRAKKSSRGKKSKKPAHSSEPAQEADDIVKTVFTAEDIIGVVPVIKAATFESRTADSFREAATSPASQDQAVELFRDSVTVQEQVYGAIHPAVARAYEEFAQACYTAKKYAEAVSAGRKALQIAERTLGSQAFETMLAVSHLTLYEAGNKQYADTLKLYRRLLNYWLVSYGQTHPSVASTLTSIGAFLSRLDRPTEASEALIKALKLSDLSNGKDSVASALLDLQIAQTMAQMRKLTETGDWADKAFNILKDAIGLNDLSTTEAHNWAVGSRNYLAMEKRQSEYMREAAKAAKKAESKAPKAKAAKHPKKLTKKQARLQARKKEEESVPNLAGKSIDEIMKYINSN